MLYWAGLPMLASSQRSSWEGLRLTVNTKPVSGDVNRRTRVLGLPVDRLGMEATLARIEAYVDEWRVMPQSCSALQVTGTERRTRQVITLNPEMAVAAEHTSELRCAIESADLVVPDGMGIVWATRMRGEAVPERVTGVDLVEAYADVAVRGAHSVFLLGAAPGIAGLAAEQLARRHPGFRVVGTYAGSPGFADEDDIITHVRAASPDVVFVAFGMPAQECWIARNRNRLGAAVAVGVGGAFDFIAGRVPRAPGWMRRAGLEWAYRLGREPWRWRRMLALPRFAARAILECTTNFSELDGSN